MCVSVGGLVLFVASEPFFFSRSSTEKYNLTLLIVGISTLMFIILILIFGFWYYLQFFIYLKNLNRPLRLHGWSR